MCHPISCEHLPFSLLPLLTKFHFKFPLTSCTLTQLFSKGDKILSIFEVLWYEAHNRGTVVMGRQSNKFLQLRHHGFGSYFQKIGPWDLC